MLGINYQATAQSFGELNLRVELPDVRISQTTGPQSRYRRQTPQSVASKEIRPILISLESLSGLTRSDDNRIQNLDQTGLQFEPRLIGVVAGQKVRVVNSDPVYHNVFSLSSVKRFDIGRRPRGEYADVVFDKTGIVQVFCDIHPHMSATIVVLPETTFKWVVAQEDSDIVISNLPNGTYRVTVYSPGFESISRQVQIENGKRTDLGSISLEAS